VNASSAEPDENYSRNREHDGRDLHCESRSWIGRSDYDLSSGATLTNRHSRDP
jgi:hypothetical protein